MLARFFRQFSHTAKALQVVSSSNKHIHRLLHIRQTPRSVILEYEDKPLPSKTAENGTWVKLRDYECNIVDEDQFLFNLREFYNDESTFAGQ